MAATVRTARLGPALATVALGAAPVVVSAFGDRVAIGAVVALALAGGASLGWAVEDPSAELLGTMPVGSPIRLAMRIVDVVAVAVAGLAVALSAAAVGPGLPELWGDVLPETIATGAIALAVGSVAVRRGERAAGPAAVTAGALTVLVLGALSYRWPESLPALAGGPVHGRWWWVTVAALAVVCHAGRDPAR